MQRGQYTPFRSFLNTLQPTHVFRNLGRTFVVGLFRFLLTLLFLLLLLSAVVDRLLVGGIVVKVRVFDALLVRGTGFLVLAL